MDWSKPVTLVGTLPANVLLKTLERAAAVPPVAGRPSGRELLRGGWVALHGMGSGLRTMISSTWGNIVQAPATADALAALLRQAGVATDAVGGYVTAWQAGQALVVVPGVPAAICDAMQAALGSGQPAGTAVDVHVPRDPIVRPADDSQDGISKDPGAFRHVDLTGHGGETAAMLPPTGGEEGAMRGDPTVAPPPQVQRYASVSAPARVTPQEQFAVTVQLTQQKRADDPSAPLVAVSPTTVGGKATGADPIQIQIRANGFDIQEPTGATLAIPAEGDSLPANFQLRAKAGVSGAQEVKLLFYQGMDLLARRILSIQVGAATQPSTPQAGLPLALPPPGNGTVADADLVLYIERDTEHGEELLFSYLWPQHGVTTITALDRMPLNNVPGWAQQRYSALSEAAKFVAPSGPNATAAIKAAAATLDRMGMNLYMALPTRVRQFYKEFAPQVQTLLVYSTEPWIPWEIVKPFNTGDGLDPALCDFWCAQFVMSRWLVVEKLRRIPSQVRVQELCAVVPQVGLAAAQRENQYLQGLPHAWPPLALYARPVGTRDDVIAAMSSGEVNLLHIATHGSFQAGAGQGAAIQLGTSQLTTEDLVGSDLVAGLTKAAPLVFINACHSNRADLALSGIGGWVERLVPFGASAFVGTNWEVQDDLAAQFAQQFYDGLRAGQTFGVACRAARQAVRTANPGNSTWLAYVLYAHPNGTLHVGPSSV
ncbi:MAG: CHAT domain-containing protein [Chloroflexota bacterium]|nr:CHAT domain-containing protein [Chloroflexota bacterium]